MVRTACGNSFQNSSVIEFICAALVNLKWLTPDSVLTSNVVYIGVIILFTISSVGIVFHLPRDTKLRALFIDKEIRDEFVCRVNRVRRQISHPALLQYVDV